MRLARLAALAALPLIAAAGAGCVSRSRDRQCRARPRTAPPIGDVGDGRR